MALVHVCERVILCTYIPFLCQLREPRNSGRGSSSEKQSESGSWFLIILQQIELELLRERDDSKTDQETYIQVSL